MTSDGRWYILARIGGCGGGRSVIDTSGEYAGCTCCWRNTDGHVTIERTLAATKAFISEWAA